MKITEIIAGGKPTVSFEVFPPKRDAALEPVKDEIIALARSEKLTAHANSIRVRFEEEK